jgi:hypothetical protein
MTLHYKAYPPDWVPEPCSDVIEWAHWFEEADRQVCRDEFHGVTVSTVFLGLATCNADLRDTSLDYMFETMVFADSKELQKILSDNIQEGSIIYLLLGGDDIQRRYRTKDEAVDGHIELLGLVKQGVAELN